MAKADDFPITFNLGEIFDENSLNDEEIQQVTVPSDVVEGLNQEIAAQNEHLTEKDGTTDPMENESRFDSLNDDEIDKIAGASNAKNTHNQTKWAVKVFRGK